MAENMEPHASPASDRGAAQRGTVAVERLKADINSLRSDLEAAARTVNQLGATAAQEAMVQAQARMEDLRERLDVLLHEAKDYGDRSTEAVRQQVQERPFASLLIAMATGFVLAHLIGRR